MGLSHKNTSTPCQDKFKAQTSEDGEWLAIAVCDGAGSAEHAEKGAEITSTFFCNQLVNLSKELKNKSPGEWINDYVIDCIIQVRKQIRQEAKSDSIKDYHCTLVAALIGRHGGFSIHIGDGALFGGTFSQDQSDTQLELNSDYIISKPENGEYSNETFFITEANWIKRLRITPLPSLDWLVVCTDGGSSLLLNNDEDVKPNFLAPFIESQLNNGFRDSTYIESILIDPKANKLTTDDKTIVLAVRNGRAALPASCKFTLNTKPQQKNKGFISGTENQKEIKTNTDKINSLAGLNKKSTTNNRKSIYLAGILALSSILALIIGGAFFLIDQQDVKQTTVITSPELKPEDDHKEIIKQENPASQAIIITMEPDTNPKKLDENLGR